MGGHIPDENFPEGIFQGEDWLVGIFPVGIFLE